MGIKWSDYIGRIYMILLVLVILIYGITADVHRSSEAKDIKQIAGEYFINREKKNMARVQYIKSIYVRNKVAKVVAVVTLSGENNYAVVDVAMDVEKKNGRWEVVYSSY